MDGFITLIILVIVFNLFSAVLRAIKGGSAGAGRQRPVRELAPASQLDRLFSIAETNDPGDPDRSEYETGFEDEAVAEVTGSLYEPKVEPEFVEDQETERAILSEPAVTRIKTPDQVNRPAPGFGIRKVLTEKDSFLAAFVLHEILDVPPALRRRRRP